ncbi:unnamed protein product [Boreogadus saida]
MLPCSLPRARVAASRRKASRCDSCKDWQQDDWGVRQRGDGSCDPDIVFVATCFEMCLKVDVRIPDATIPKVFRGLPDSSAVVGVYLSSRLGVSVAEMSLKQCFCDRIHIFPGDSPVWALRSGCTPRQM